MPSSLRVAPTSRVCSEYSAASLLMVRPVPSLAGDTPLAAAAGVAAAAAARGSWKPRPGLRPLVISMLGDSGSGGGSLEGLGPAIRALARPRGVRGPGLEGWAG